jgi:hypothetical protein
MRILDVEGREEEKFQIFNTNSTLTLITLILKARHNDVFTKLEKKITDLREWREGGREIQILSPS